MKTNCSVPCNYHGIPDNREHLREYQHIHTRQFQFHSYQPTIFAWFKLILAICHLHTFSNGIFIGRMYFLSIIKRISPTAIAIRLRHAGDFAQVTNDDRHIHMSNINQFKHHSTYVLLKEEKKKSKRSGGKYSCSLTVANFFTRLDLNH